MAKEQEREGKCGVYIREDGPGHAPHLRGLTHRVISGYMPTVGRLGLLLLTLEAKPMKCSPSGALPPLWQRKRRHDKLCTGSSRCHLEVKHIMPTNTEMAKARQSHGTQF